MLTKDQHIFLLQKSLSVKKRFLKMYQSANAGHIGASLSCADIVTFIFFNWMNDNSEFILSKGHAAACIYSALAEKNVLSQADIDTFYQNDTYLAAHPPPNKIKGITFATGSLGHGLSLAAGIGLAHKLKNNDTSVFCLTSDGELNEGSIWEAAQFIVHHQLTNVVWLIDKNNWQGFGNTSDVLNPQSLSEKCKAFGFCVIETNGHDMESMQQAKEAAIAKDKPVVIICETIKGKGWVERENTLACHYLPFKQNEFDTTIAVLETEYQRNIELNES